MRLNLIIMIQRIQSVYLLLAAAALVAFNFLALGVDTTPVQADVVFGKELMPSFIASLVVAGLALLSIFLYSNRVLQANVCKLNIFLTIVVMGIAGYLLFGNPANDIEKVLPGIGMPVLAIIFIALGLKGIGADEKLVRSMDRLR